MSEVCLHLLTKIEVACGEDALARIWSINNWVRSVDRVVDLDMKLDCDTEQCFTLVFDGGRETLDQVDVQRFRAENEIRVVHKVPPPGIQSLTALWWTEPEHDKWLFVRRTMLMDREAYSADRTRQMFALLRENLTKLLGPQLCNHAY